MKNTVNVLGTIYTIEVHDYKDDVAFEKNGIDGYCEQGTHRIIIGNLASFPNWSYESNEFVDASMKHTLRHEIIHAFFNESGLQDSADRIANEAWSKHEEMVDWWAIQGVKVYQAWVESGAV